MLERTDLMKQENPEKLEKSRQFLELLKKARGGSIMDSHRKMGNDPMLVKAFLDGYTDNATDTQIPRKYRELIVMAIGMATGTDTTMKVHSRLALETGATVDDICEVIRIIFFTCGVTKLLPILEKLDLEPVKE